VEFIAVTQSDELLEQLGQALDGESAIRHADTIAAARELIQGPDPCVVMIDAREHQNPGEVIDQLQPANGLSVIVVFAPADQTGAVAQAIKRSPTFAVLPVPLETAKTAAVLEGAREEALARRNVAARPQEAPQPLRLDAATNRPAVRPTRSVSGSDFAADARAEAGPPTRSGPPRALIIGGIVAVVLVAAAAAWVVLRGSEATGPASTASSVEEPASTSVTDEPPAPMVAPSESAPAAVPTEATPSATPAQQAFVQAPIDELLDKARIAFRDRRYTDPEKDNALLYYRSALAQEPDNGEALEGLTRIGGLLEGRLQSAMTEQRYDEASATLARLKFIKPADPELKATEAKLVEVRISAALESNEADRAAALLRQATQSGVLPPERTARLREEVERRQVDARTQRLARARLGPHPRGPAGRARQRQCEVLRGAAAESRRRLATHCRRGARAGERIPEARA
jgi:hypothetical protein